MGRVDLRLFPKVGGTLTCKAYPTSSQIYQSSSFNVSGEWGKFPNLLCHTTMKEKMIDRFSHVASLAVDVGGDVSSSQSLAYW